MSELDHFRALSTHEDCVSHDEIQSSEGPNANSSVGFAGQLNRREMLSVTAAIGAASVLTSSQELSAAESKDLMIIDTNASLFHWPFRRLPLDSTEELITACRSLTISQAWVGSFEAILHRDFVGVNDRLFDECHKAPELVPIGEINPMLPGWENDVERCIQKYQMPGFRIHPNYHGYQLDDPSFVKLLNLASEASKFVQIAVTMEDTRTQHPLTSVPDVDVSSLPSTLKQVPKAKVQLLNLRPRGAVLSELLQHPGVFCDVSRVDSTDGIASLVRSAPSGRVCFGTHAPFLIPEAALIRVAESRFSENELQSVLSGAAKLLS